MGEQPWTPISQYCGLACGVWTAVLPLVHGPCLQPPTPQPFDSRGVLVEMSPTQSSWPSISQVAQLVTGPPFCLAFQSPDGEPCISYLKHRGQKKKKSQNHPFPHSFSWYRPGHRVCLEEHSLQSPWQLGNRGPRWERLTWPPHPRRTQGPSQPHSMGIQPETTGNSVGPGFPSSRTKMAILCAFG